MLAARRLLLVAAAVPAMPAAAHADTWVSAEAPAAIPVSDAQSGVFKPGVMPAFGLYLGNGRLAVGGRVRVGVLRNGPAPGDNLGDPGLGGLGTAGAALRVMLHGAWIEGVAGGGVTGHDVVPALEGGVGWSFSRGGFDIGPSARYVHVVADRGMGNFGSADLMLVGVDVTFGKARPQRAARIAPVIAVAPPAPPPPPAPEPAPVFELDHDRTLDVEPSCAEDPEGCPLETTAIEVHDDRIVLDERVLFDSGRAHVHSKGRDVIAEIGRLWRAHPDWSRLTVEGHTDVRGSDELNQELSQRRAERVRDVFVKLGFDIATLDAIGYGKSRPRDPGLTPEAHQHNRRVEFVIERRGVQ
jgi:outer membrane protein OmpA-like peptidoglycan-associated protein